MCSRVLWPWAAERLLPHFHYSSSPTERSEISVVLPTLLLATSTIFSISPLWYQDGMVQQPLLHSHSNDPIVIVSRFHDKSAQFSTSPQVPRGAKILNSFLQKPNCIFSWLYLVYTMLVVFDLLLLSSLFSFRPGYHDLQWHGIGNLLWDPLDFTMLPSLTWNQSNFADGLHLQPNVFRIYERTGKNWFLCM